MSEIRSKILLADDHPMMLEGLRKLLEPDYAVVGAVLDGHALLEAAKSCRPDLILVDISMPELDGIEATRRLQGLVPTARVVILSLHTEPHWVQAAFEAGARGYLSKSSAPEEIEIALREVLLGRFYVSPEVTRGLFAAPPEPAAEPGASPERGTDETLTPRESEIVHLVGKGLGNKEIARELGVSVTTVRTHLNRVYDKLEQGSRVELALYAAHVADASNVANVVDIPLLANAEEVMM